MAALNRIDPGLGLDYSLRRYYVDDFHQRRVSRLRPQSRVLDLGGHKVGKRGQFTIAQYDLRVCYANLVVTKQPDVQTDAARLPFVNGCFETVICSELLEHVAYPDQVLAEAARILVIGGTLLISVPFLVQIHGDPDDYGRYTDHYWQARLQQAGFAEVHIEKQGYFLSVLVDMLRGWANVWTAPGQGQPAWVRALLARVIGALRQTALRREARSAYRNHPYYSRFTTGFGIQATKRPSE